MLRRREKYSIIKSVLKPFVSKRRPCLSCGRMFNTTRRRSFTCLNCFQKNSEHDESFGRFGLNSGRTIPRRAS